MHDAFECPQCHLRFEPRRSNQKYCSDPCRKNASRGSRSAENSSRSMRHYERAQRLGEKLYSAAPQYRLGVIQDMLHRVPSDGGLRNILTDPSLLSEPPRANNKLNIVKAANAYTKMFFGVSIPTYVRRIRRGEEVEGIEIRWPVRIR